MSHNSPANWYEIKRPIYQGLADSVAATLNTLLRKHGIEVLSVTCRAKETTSVAEKIRRKSYGNPENDLTDLAGVRIVAYLETDIQKIADLINSTFEVINDESLDKSAVLGTDRIGYRSIHFVCRLGTNRENLPEYSSYAKLKFEIQVRTVLQHAWAEIEHDRNYKFAGVLPAEVKRRLFLIAGLLELADREFAAVSGQIQTIATRVSEAAKQGDLDAPITTVSLYAYLAWKAPTFKKATIDLQTFKVIEVLAQELLDFGLTSLGDFDHLVEKHRHAIEDYAQRTTYLGFVRDVLLLEDAKGYFDRAWKHNWVTTDPKTVEFFAKYGDGGKFNELLAANRITLFDEDALLYGMGDPPFD